MDRDALAQPAASDHAHLARRLDERGLSMRLRWVDRSSLDPPRVPYASIVPRDDHVRILRVIARLNVGGPALHVSYLTSELDRIGYETTLVAGRVGEGEGSMEDAAVERGIHPVYVPALQREISPTVDFAAIAQVRDLIRRVRPHVLHTHTAKAGAVGRIAARLAGADRPPVVVHTFHGHVLRGYFSPKRTEFFRRLERGLARWTDALIA